MEPITTRRYNTNKADWTEFCLQLRNTLQKYGIAEKVERTKRPEDLEANSREYIAAIQEPPREKGRNRRLPTAKTIYTQKAEIARQKAGKSTARPRTRKACGTKIEDKPVEGLRLSEDDPPFTMVELKAVLRELNPKRLRDQTA
ncbi:hypothetical protein EVAR_85880_1 [Eumeta japonica]|uniref:Uncharacterized protein n=1 Tax=Eumeta variegata TaxID=151549 RepID=A0A4C2A3W2_EUMVA|nr:hypothetical protein EVAR_85880_1 [Eumeta japonica]